MGQTVDKVLVVEDSKSIQVALKPALEGACGVQVLAAHTYAEAMRLIDEHGPSLFLAILDLALPDAMNGEVVGYASAHNVPSVVFTSSFDAATRKHLLSKGIIDYIVKQNRSVDDLVHTVRRLQLNRNVRVLVVDDSASARTSIQSSLALYKFQVLTAESGEAALAVLGAEGGVDLVLTDFEMPGMDGVELTGRIRLSYAKEELAIVGVSSTKNETLAPRFLKFGANDFLHKPFGREELYCRVLNSIEALEHIRAVKTWAQRLRQSEDHNRDLVQYAPTGIFRSTPQGRYLEVNPYLAKMYGYDSPQELLEQVQDIGTQIYVDSAERDQVQSILQEGNLEGVEIRRRRKDGEIIWVSLSMRAIRGADGSIQCYEGFSRDVTERKQAEGLRDQIERVIRHDLRAPVSNAQYCVQLLRLGENITPEQHKILNTFEASARQMLDTLNSSLELYRIESGQYQPQPEAFDVAILMRELVESVSEAVEKKGIRLDIVAGGSPLTPECTCMCLGQRNLLQRALQNLLINALEASPGGSAVRVEVSGGSECTISIRNTGAVPVEVRSRFFDKYATHGKEHGTGLGTYSARLMVKSQGGDIRMSTSDEDNETVVTVLLPVPEGQ